MKKKLFTGVATALATPFTDTGINLKEFENFIDLQIKSGINALVVCGTTGEASTMTKDEKIDLIKCAISVCNKRVPIIVGTGSNNTSIAIEMSKLAEKLGADGLLIVTPYYNKTTQNGLIKHYKSIANSVDLPIILYNVPSRTGMNISPETCLELSKIENIAGIKEASGNISQDAKISALSNINPSLTLNITNSFWAGNINEAKNYQLKALPIINALFEETNPIPVKEALNLLGFNFGTPRLPLVQCSESLTEKLNRLINTV